MVHTIPEIVKTSNLILDLEFHQHLGSYKHVINIIMWFRDMGCYTNSSHLRRIARAVETESYIFLGKRIVAPSPATHIKLVSITLIALRHFSLLPSHLPLPSSFTAQWLTPLFMPPLLPLSRRLAPMTQGTIPGRKALQWWLI
jgi:hypothetical protein